MNIRVARHSDLPTLAEIDTGPGRWAKDTFEQFVLGMGVVKLVEEGPWVLGWIACLRRQNLAIVERLAYREGDSEAALRLFQHMCRLLEPGAKIDLALSDRQFDIVPDLVARGFELGYLRNYWGRGDDAVCLTKIHGDADQAGNTVARVDGPVAR